MKRPLREDWEDSEGAGNNHSRDGAGRDLAGMASANKKEKVALPDYVWKARTVLVVLPDAVAKLKLLSGQLRSGLPSRSVSPTTQCYGLSFRKDAEPLGVLISEYAEPLHRGEKLQVKFLGDCC